MFGVHRHARTAGRRHDILVANRIHRRVAGPSRFRIPRVHNYLLYRHRALFRNGRQFFAKTNNGHRGGIVRRLHNTHRSVSVAVNGKVRDAQVGHPFLRGGLGTFSITNGIPTIRTSTMTHPNFSAMLRQRSNREGCNGQHQ